MMFIRHQQILNTIWFMLDQILKSNCTLKSCFVIYWFKFLDGVWGYEEKRSLENSKFNSKSWSLSCCNLYNTIPYSFTVFNCSYIPKSLSSWKVSYCKLFLKPTSYASYLIFTGCISHLEIISYMVFDLKLLTHDFDRIIWQSVFFLQCCTFP